MKQLSVFFLRMNNSNSFDWNKEWNRKGDLNIPSDKNCCTVSGWGGNTENVSWSTYTPPVTHTFAKNSTLYIDFRAITDADKGGANYPKAGTATGLDYSLNAGGTVIPVTFTADVKWAEGSEFLKTDKGGWASIPFKAPEAGQNCAQVAADGKSYTWTIYSEPSVTLSLDKTEADAGTEVTVTLTATADNVSGEVTYAFQYSTDNATWNNITATDNTATQTFAAETRYYKVTMTNGGTTKEATAKFSAIKFHVIGSWDSWAAHNEVVEGSKTITLEANKTYEYKITNGTWDLSWGNDGTMDRNNCTDWSFESNNNAKIKTDEAGDYVFNVSRNAEGKVKVSVVYPELSAPIPTFDYYIAGNMNGWDKAHVDYGMTDEDEDGIYEKEITLAAGQDHQFKVTNGKWGNETDGFDCADVEGAYEEVDSKDGNVLVKLNTETTFTVKFNKNTGKITFEGLTEKAPEPTYDYYLTGSLVGGWDVKQQGIEKDGELYKATFNALAAGTYEFKITAGDWEHQWNYNNLGAAYEEVSQGVDGEENPNGNIKIVTEEAKNITVIFDATAGKITFEGLTPYVAPLTYTVTVPAGTEKCYIAGNMNGWAFQEMEAVTGETNKFTITIVGAKETDEYKYACQADWVYAEVIDGGGNRTNWSELDEVTAWGKPVVYTYYLMGVDGDWTTGIEMEVNTGAENEVMLTCQPVNGEVKIKRLGDDESEYWYGGKSLKEEAGNLGTNTEAATDGDGNIALEEGIYNFYFNTADGKLWIAAATPDYTRDVTSGDYGTICLPNGGQLVGASAFSVLKMEGTTIILYEVGTTMVAGTPYVVFPNTGATKLYVFYTDNANAPAGEANGLCGSYERRELDANVGYYIMLPGNRYAEVTGNRVFVAANRAYFKVDDIDDISTTALAPAPGVRRIAIGQAPQVATGVDQVQGDNVPTKTIINGQLFILRGEKMYDAQGKLVK